MNNIIEKGKRFLTPVLTWKYNICLTKGEGVFVWDSEDKNYPDFTSGTAVLNIGHTLPNVLRFIPPIIVKREELEHALDIIEESLWEAV